MKTDKNDNTPLLLEDILTAMKGFCMGAADVVPGVSGGTMAFILGIYERLIGGIRSFDLLFFKHILSLRFKEALDHVPWRFLITLGLGILLAIFSLARLLSWLLQNQPVLIWSFFFGLILSSIFVVSRHIDKWAPGHYVSAFLGAVVAYVLVGLVPVSTPDTPWFLFVSGAVAICAMILPGISGSFILVLLGKYRYVLDAVNNRDLLVLFIVSMGALFGLMSFVRVLNWLLKKSHDITIALLIGLMLGSLRKVWPWKQVVEIMTDGDGKAGIAAGANIMPSTWSPEVTLAILLMLAGLVLVLTMDRLADRTGRRHKD